MFVALLRIGAVLAALSAVVTGLFFTAWALVALAKLGADYQDSAPATYLIVGVVLLGIAGACFLSAAGLVWAACTRSIERTLRR